MPIASIFRHSKRLVESEDIILYLLDTRTPNPAGSMGDRLMTIIAFNGHTVVLAYRKDAPVLVGWSRSEYRMTQFAATSDGNMQV